MKSVICTAGYGDVVGVVGVVGGLKLAQKATPKSLSLIVVSVSCALFWTRKFSGFTSRCVIPREWSWLRPCRTFSVMKLTIDSRRPEGCLSRRSETLPAFISSKTR